MAFQTFPINVTGPSYQSRSKAVSSQATINFYPEFSESGKAPFILQSWPGQKAFGTTAGVDRGQHKMAKIEYRVAGNTLYEVGKSGTHTSRGTIAGSDRCIFANDGENMFIVHDSTVDQYSAATNLITPVTDVDIVGAIAVDFINNQFIYTKPNLFIVSDVGDGSKASGLNAAQAEFQPDDLVRAYVFDGLVYMLGDETVEPWYNSGEGLPPFERIDTQIISIGIAAIHSVNHNDNFMYWLGDDRQVYQAAGGSEVRVSSIGIAHLIESFDTVDDAIGMTLTLEGQNFYILDFPTENKTIAINEGLGEDGWYELSADNSRGRWNVSSINRVYGKHLAADRLTGALYELDLDTFTNSGGTEIQRTRVLSSIHGGLMNAPGKELQMSRFELIMQKGVGLISGQGENPRIMIEVSEDQGESYGQGVWAKVGRMGQSNLRVEWFDLRVFTDMIIRITTSDPVQYTILTGAIDLRRVDNG